MLPKKTFHILAPRPKKVGVANEFYRDSDLRIKKTLCGQTPTTHDIRFAWASDIEFEYFVLCPECERIKQQAVEDRKWQARKKRNVQNAKMWRGD